MPVSCARLMTWRFSVTDLQAWVDETHPDALKHIALKLLDASQLIPETETESGEGSGGSSDS